MIKSNEHSEHWTNWDPLPIQTTGVMKKMNDQNKSAELMKTLEEFSKQNKIMDMKDELINETLSEALEGSDDEAEEDAVVNQGLLFRHLESSSDSFWLNSST